MELSGNHRAIVDALATVKILVYEIFWKIRDKCIYKVNNVGAVVGNAPVLIRPNDDSDTDDETPIKEVGDTVSVSSGSDNDDDKLLDAVDDDETEEETDDNNVIVEPLGWKLDTPFQGIDTTKRFQQVLKTRSSRRDDGEIVTGMKVLKTSANSPAKAWRLIMTTTILDKIVEYSNDYGHY
jgi:hypothetical protein